MSAPEEAPPPNRIPLAQALKSAEKLRGHFDPSTHTRWTVAGDARRRTELVTRVRHVVLPMPDAGAADQAEAFAFTIDRPPNPVWLRLDQLMAAAVVRPAYFGVRLGFVWTDAYRAFSFEGVEHGILVARRTNHGLALIASTGPGLFVRDLFDVLKARGFRVRNGLQLSDAKGHTADASTEERVFELAGLPYVAPDRR